MSSDDRLEVGLPMTRSLGFVLAKAAQRVAAAGEAALRELGVSTRDVGVLTVIRERGPMSQRSLGEALRIDRTTIVTLVDRLEAAGLLRRADDPADRRAFLVTLTSAGEAVVPRAWEVVDGVESAALGGLAARERDALRDWLVRIANGGRE
jgi:DNA-binding MarR family transcriptional regulator